MLSWKRCLSQEGILGHTTHISTTQPQCCLPSASHHVGGPCEYSPWCKAPVIFQGCNLTVGTSSSHMSASPQSPEKTTGDFCCPYQPFCILISWPVGLPVNSGLVFYRCEVQESVHMAFFQELVWDIEQQYLFF